jgi:hypothetical protein
VSDPSRIIHDIHEIPPPGSDESYIKQTQELAAMALQEAKNILQYGPSQQKIQVVKSVLGVLARQAAAGQDAVANEMRVKMEALMVSMRDVPVLERTISETYIVDAEIVEE